MGPSEKSGFGHRLLRVLAATALVLSHLVLVADTADAATWTPQVTPLFEDVNAIDMVDATIGYAAGKGGAVWKTVDGGVTFNPVPAPTTEELLAVEFVDANTGYVVGAKGVILKTTDGGVTWTMQTHPAGTVSLTGVSFPVDSSSGTVVGVGPTILTTTNGGATWELRSSVTDQLEAVDFPIDNVTGFAVGLGGRVMKTTNGGVSWHGVNSPTTDDLYGVDFLPDGVSGYAVGKGGIIFKTTDGAVSWTTQVSGTTDDLYSVHFPVDATTGYAVGQGGIIVKTTDGGATWVTQVSGVSNHLQAIYFPVDNDTGFAVGDGSTILTTSDAGSSWVAPPPSGSTKNLQAIHFPTSTTVGYTVGQDGTILKTTDGGTGWAPQPSGVSKDLFGVNFADDDVGYTVGQDGTILKTIDGGTTWAPQSSTTTENLFGVVFPVDGSTGFAVGKNGVTPRTNDGGATWTVPMAATTEHLTAVHYPSATIGYSAGAKGTIIKTTDGGTTWAAQVSGTTEDLNGITFADDSVGYAAGQNGTILKTINGGATWEAQASGTAEDLLDVDFADALNGTAVGKFKAGVVTTDGGATWLPLSNPIPGDIAGVATPMAGTIFLVGPGPTIARSIDGGATWTSPTPSTLKLFALDFATPAIGYAVGEKGQALKTTDGGTSWNPLGTPVSTDLNDVHFVNATTGYLVGKNGTILKTTDGGANFSSLPSGITNDLFAVSFPVDATTGYAVGKSGTIVKTTDSGANWFTQVSGTLEDLYDADFADNSAGVAVGKNGIIVQTSDGGAVWSTRLSGVTSDLNAVELTSDPDIAYVVGKSGVVLKSTDGGSAWSSLTSGTTEDLEGVSFPVDSVTGFVAGNKGIVLATTDGTTWSTSDTPVSSRLHDVSFTSNTIGAAVGDGPTIITTTDSTDEWIDRTPSAGHVFAIDFPTGPSTGFAVGKQGSVLKTTDGVNWQPLSPPTTEDLVGLDFVDDNNGFAVGKDGLIVKTTNGGIGWSTLTSGTLKDLKGVAFPVDALTGFVVGKDGTILKTTDGGSAWSILTSGTSKDLFAISFPTDATVGFAVGQDGTILKTTDGGGSWSLQTTPTTEDLLAVSFPFDTMTGYAAGKKGVVLKTTDGGSSWSLQTTPTTEDLYGVDFATGALGHAVGKNGTVLHTDDGGAGWTTDASGTTKTLRAVTFPTNTADGWAAGEGPTILKGFDPPPPNTPPTAVDDATSTTQDTAVMIDVLANDFDPDGDPLTVDSVTQGTNGTVVNNGTDATYTPNASWTGIDTFTYTASDGNGGFDTATVTVTVDPTTVVVNSTGDAGDSNVGDGFCDTGGQNSQLETECTLRAALAEANGSATIEVVHFDIPASELGHSGGIWTIAPGSPLPPVATTMSIDGSTQPGYATTPIVEISGDGAGTDIDGFIVTGDNATIRGLTINRFTDDGIQVNAGATGTTIAGNHIGTDPSGLVDRGNLDKGIDLQSGSGPSTIGGVNPADRNVISGNNDDGIVIWQSSANVIIGNYIGTDATGNSPLPNGSDGISMGGTGADTNIIGQPGAGNVLSGNTDDGIELAFDVSDNVLQGNIIGLGADGDTLVANGRHGVVIYDGANSTRIGGSGAGEGNVISGNTETGVHINGNSNSATTGNLVVGNIIGTDSSGTTARANGTAGIHIFGGAHTNVVGGTAASHRNVISGNGGYGIDIEGSGTDANVVSANYIGTDLAGTADVGNTTDGVAIRGGAQGNTVGGLTTAERNIIAGNNNDGVWITGLGTDNNLVQGNWIGFGVDGSAVANSFHGVAVENAAADNMIGGDTAAASNRIGNSLWDGVAIAGGTGSGNSILGNSIVDNTGLGIDLDNDGVTANDVDDVDTGPNGLLNFPEITSATELTGTVTVDYDLDVPTGSYRVEFFANPSGSDATGYGEGETFVHAQTIAHAGAGTEAFTTTFTGSAGDVLTATATRILPGPTYSSTSEFSQAFTVTPEVVALLSGSVLEDVNGDGDILDDGVGVPGVAVSIYADQGDGDPDNGDTAVGSTVTDGSGDWSVTVYGDGTYWATVDSTNIAPAAGYNPSFGIGDVWADQTYGSVGAVSFDGSVFSYSGADGPLFGGRESSRSDDFATLAGSEHVHRVIVAGSDVSGIDSGLSFQALTNTVDDLDPAQHQGSLRQFIENSEAVAGQQTSRFAIPTTDPGYSASPLSYTIQPVADLPTITDQVVVDASTQAGFAGTPVVELDGSLIGAGSTGLTIDSTATTVRGFVINRFETAISVTGGADNVVVGNYLGPDVTGLIGEVGNTAEGLFIANATGTIIGGTNPADRNVISGNRLRGIWIDDFGDGPAPTASGTVLLGNYIGPDAAGAAALPFDGVGSYQQIGMALWDGPANTIGGAGPGEANVISGNDWYGIYIWGPNATGNTVQGNIIGLDQSATSPVGNGADDPTTRSGVYLSAAPGNLIGGTGAGEGNIIAGNDANGVIVQNAGSVANSILGNQIYGNTGIGIDLGMDGVTNNDSLDTDSGANDLLNFPELAEASAAGGTLTLEMTLDVPAGDYRIEFFTNPSGSDPSGHGEGEVFRHGELIAHPGGGPQTYQVSFSGNVGDVVSATTTELFAGLSYGSTSEFSQVVVAAAAGGLFADSSERRSDLAEVGTVDRVPGTAGMGARFSGAGDRLVGPATDLVSGELTMSAWVNPTGLGTDPRIVAKTASDGNTVYELLIDDATSEAVARIKVGGSTVEVRGGSISIGAWHQVAATWDGATITLYVDGVPVDSAAAVGALATDLTMPLVIGNVGAGTRSFNGTIDHVRVSHAARPTAWITTALNNISDPASFVSIGGPQTGIPGPWLASAGLSRTGSFALSAPETVDGADAWATAIGIDEPGVEFEAWWQLSDPTLVDAAGGTRTGAAPTDQNETALAGSVFDLGSIVGGTRIQDATSVTGAPPATWVKVVVRTDETGTSSVWIDDLMVIGPTLHSAGGSSGSIGLRIGELPVGETWHIDDVQLRRLVSDEPVTSLGPLDRN